MIDVLDQAGDKDYSRTRKIVLETNTINVTCNDPFGFWTVSFDKGQLPEKLTGEYTTFEEAMKDITVYLAEKDRPVKEKVL